MRDRLEALVRGTPHFMAMLAAVEATGLPDAWIAAGAVRSLVWDHLHGRPPATDWADVDVLYFDASDTTKAPEQAAEARLNVLMPGIPWEVRNQARMHAKTGQQPYRDTEDGLRHFAETPTAVAVRLRDTHIGILAPHGLGDLFDCIARPVFDAPEMAVFYRDRMAAKNWPARWPKVRVLGLEGD